MKNPKMISSKKIYSSELLRVELGQHEYARGEVLRISADAIGTTTGDTHLDLEATDIGLVADELTAVVAMLRLAARRKISN
jgi:hypothetical protein